MSDTYCEHCGRPIGAPHLPLTSDCVLPHPDHKERFQGLLCARHFHWMTDTLKQIEELFALLPEVLLPSLAQLSGERHGSMDGSPAPGRIDVMALTDRRAVPRGDDDMPDVPGSLLEHAARVVEERGLTDVLDGTVTGSIRLLQRERRWLAHQAWVDDYTGEIARLHRAVARGVGDSMWPRSIGRCPNCTAPLYITVGVDEVTCRKCRSAWTGAALTRLRLIHEQEAGQAS